MYVSTASTFNIASLKKKVSQFIFTGIFTSLLNNIISKLEVTAALSLSLFLSLSLSLSLWLLKDYRTVWIAASHHECQNLLKGRELLFAWICKMDGAKKKKCLPAHNFMGKKNSAHFWILVLTLINYGLWKEMRWK